MKMVLKYIGMVIVLSMLVQPAFADVDDCGVGPPCQGYADDVPGVTCCPVAVPFDGGITLMLAAGGIGMGVRAVRKKKRAISRYW